jgi:outer membrane cobalamin receptor
VHDFVRSSSKRVVAAFFALITAVCTSPVLADSPLVAAVAPATAVISGAVKTPDGTAIPGAKVSVSGPTVASTTADGSGAFSISVAPGIYTVSASKGGYASASISNLVVVAGQAQPLAVTMSQNDLTSLRTIGTVTTRSRVAAINTSSSTSTYVSAEAFSNLASPLINDVLQRIPEVTIQHLGSQPDTSIIVGGAQPYETQVLFDGHPVALGQYGVWTSQYFPSYLIGGAEVQSGPGNTTPFANLAVGGTLNLQSPGFTTKPVNEFTIGLDNYGSQYSNLLSSGKYGKVSYVLALGTAGQNDQYFHRQECSVSIDGTATAINGYNTGIISFCGDTSASLYTRGVVAKLKYDFSPETSFDVGFVGAWGGYSPQGTAPGWGLYWGPTQIEACQSYNVCTNPAQASLIGKTITGYTWYPGTVITNDQTLFDGQFRTSFGDTTLLIRPYLGVIEPEAVQGQGEGYYPQFFGQPPGTPGYQAPSCPNGTTIPNCTVVANGGGNNFETTQCPLGTPFSYSQLQSPQNTVVDVNGQQQCFQYPYTTWEQDKLYGSTFSIIKPFGDSTFTLTYDFHGESTFAYFNVNAPETVSVPLTSTRYSTISGVGDFKVAKSLNLKLGLYDTQWTVAGVQPLLDSAGGVVIDGNGNVVPTGLNRKVTRFDPHVSLVYHPESSLSVRAAWGTSTTFPFAGLVSGYPSYQAYGSSAPLYTAGVLTEKNPNLAPETSTEFSLGFDKRIGSSILSLDLQNTAIHNVFQNVLQQQPAPSTYPCFASPCILGVSSPINIALLQSKLAILKFSRTPRYGFGYSISAAAESSIISGVPLSYYNSSGSFPANNVQICGPGYATVGAPTCIPYLKGYGLLTYQGKGARGTYVGLGVDYEGKNNAFYSPPLALADLTVTQPVTKFLELQLTIQNLLNTNVYEGLVQQGQGEPVVAQTSTGQTSYNGPLINAQERTVRIQGRFHF